MKVWGKMCFSRMVINAIQHNKKMEAVQNYLAGKGSQEDICKKYGIRSKSKLQKWIKQYNGHEELKVSRTGGYPIMTEGIKTTFNKRVEMVQYCITHEHNYAKTAELYQISYQQARNYTVKYEANGVKDLEINVENVKLRIK